MENTPMLNMSLKEYYNIIVNGGKITRNKTDQSKTINNEKTPKKSDQKGSKTTLKLKKKTSKIKVKGELKDKNLRKIKKEKKLSKKKNSLSTHNKSNHKAEDSKNISKEEKILIQKIRKIKMIRKENNVNFSIDYEIVPYNEYFDKRSKTISFELSEKIAYNKIISFENYKDRLILFRSKKNDQLKYSIGTVLDLNLDEEKQLTINYSSITETEINEDIFFNGIPNMERGTIDSRNFDIFLIEFTFCLGNISDVDYLVILTEFCNKSEDGKTVIENRYFATCFSSKQNRIISKIENRKLILLEESCDENSHLNNKDIKFFQTINKVFLEWLEKQEFQRLNKVQIENYELHECIYPKKEYYHLGLLLKYNKTFESVFVVSYRGDFEWIPLKKIKENNEDNEIFNILNTKLLQEIDTSDNKSEKTTKINTLKGKVSLKQLSNTDYRDNFYKNLVFSRNESKINRPEELGKNNSADSNKEMESIADIINSECQNCTYKINNFEYRKCRNCKIILHVQCIPSYEQNYESDNYWLCKLCKPCNNCHSNVKNSSKNYCSVCFSCYHFECLNEAVYTVQQPQDVNKNNWKCENCAKCLGCDKMLYKNHKNQISNSANYLEYCLNCEKRLDKNEFCPICKKLWKTDEMKMIECKCKMWVHQVCDRILNDDYFKKLSKKTNNYFCPLCRIKEKNVHIDNILNLLIKQDKYCYFSLPVDNKVKNYTNVIKKPMCFQWMKDKIEKGVYLESPEEFENDFTTIFTNAKIFNMPNTKIYKEAEFIHERGMEILENNLGIIYSLSVDYYLFDHNFPNNNFKEILNLVKTKFEHKLEKLNLHKIKEKIKEYKVGINITDLVPEGKNLISSNVVPNQISYSDSSLSTMKKRSTSNVNNLNIDDEYKMGMQIDLQNLQNIEINNLYFPKKVEDIDYKVEDIKESSSQINNFQKILLNPNVDEINYTNDLIPKIEIEQNDLLIPSTKNQNLIEETFEIENQLIKNEGKNFTNDEYNKNQFTSILDPNNQENFLKESVQLNNDENQKETNYKEEINNVDENMILNETNKQEASTKSMIKCKQDTKKNKSKMAKDFENYLEKSMNNFTARQKSDLKYVDNKMEIIEGNDNYFEDEEENFISNYIQKNSNGVDNSLKFFYLNKYKEKLEGNYESYLDFAYGCSIFRQIIKDMKKSKNTNKSDLKSEYVPKDSKKRLKLISKTKDKKELNLDVIVPEEKQPKSIKLEVSDFDYLKKKKERPKVQTEKKEEQEKEKEILVPVIDKLNNSKFKSEEVLYQENYNFKSLLPPPILVSFPDQNLIFQKICFLCASFDQVDYMITCSFCFESFHSFCTSNSEQLTNNIKLIKKTNWKCLNCKFCEKCQTNTNDHELLYCDSCDASLHTYCLDVKLYQIPESGWKCLNCFSCQNCKSNKYYSDKFKIDEKKDYSILTRNFTYCFECGFKLFYQSLCNKCEKSEYKDYSKNIIFIENKEDLLNKVDENDYSDDNIILMITCRTCKNWFHLKCLGFTKEYLSLYFKDYENFRCLDCFTEKKYKGELQEITFVRYLELLQMSYIIMSFSKLILIILKLMTKDSNIKLHSKLFKVFLQENIKKLLGDQDICFFIEAIKQDIFIHKNGKIGEKKKKKSPQLSKRNDEIDKMLTDSIPNLEDNVNLEENIISETNQKEQFQTIKYFDLTHHLKHKNLFNEKFLIEKYKYFSNPSLNLNEEIKENIHLVDTIELKSNNYLSLIEVKDDTQFMKNIAKDIVIPQPEPKNESLNKENMDLETLLKSNEKLEISSKLKTDSKNRINFTYDSKLEKELNNFLDNKEKNIKVLKNYFDNPESKILTFYSFDYPNYFSAIDQKETKVFINEVLKKFESFLKSKNFGKIFSKFWLQLNYKIIIKLKVEFLKWLIEKIRDSYTQSPKDVSKMMKNNLIYPFFIDFTDKYINENPFFIGELIPQDSKQDEELSKLIDYIDPLDNNITFSLTCEFCNRKGSRKYSGRLIPIKGESWGHVNCILWSRGVIENSENGSLMNVLLIMNKMKSFKCYLCKKANATLSCESKKCNKNYHFVCAMIKQSSFTKNKQFFCNKCTGIKDEHIYDFNTFRKYTILRNTEWIHDYKLSDKSKIQLIPKYMFGSFNAFGNTTIIKLANLHSKENVFDSYDIVCIKKIIKENKDLYLLFLLNDRFISVNGISDPKNLLRSNIIKEKIMKIHKKIDKDLLEQNLSSFLQKDGIFFNNPLEKIIDFSNDSQLKSFNDLFENFLKNKVYSNEELDLCRKINRKVSNSLYFFNLNFIPIIIFMRCSSFYISQYSDFSSNCDQNLNVIKSNENETKNNKKEAKNKLESFINSIKEKNKTGESFRFIDYLSNHKSIKIARRNLGENVNNHDKEKKTSNKYNKQIYKNLERTMNTNIMETDLPLAMKYRNYKALTRKVTVGPSLIHRNGLMATGDFLPGEIVIEYCGELISNHVADFREQEYNIRGFGDCYLFRLDSNQIIDATKYGNLARFINHRCDPNCSAQSNVILDKKHIILYAKRHIKAGEEITYDYNFECEAEKILCRCGSKNCQGRLN